VCASDVIDVMRHLAEESIDALLLNYDLPAVNAADLIADLRARATIDDTAVAVFTRDGSPAIAGRCRAVDAGLIVDPSTPKARVKTWFEEVLRATSIVARAPALDLDMATSIGNATCEVMSAILGSAPERGRLKVEKARIQTADVIGSISVSGFVTGSITLFMSLEFASSITRSMLGEELGTPGDEVVVDAIGEMTNMIAGNIKTALCRQQEVFSMSAPSVTIGREVRRLTQNSHLSFLLPFTWQNEPFLVELSLIPKSTQRARSSAMARQPS
jgi:chemotaxis protein CheX